MFAPRHENSGSLAPNTGNRYREILCRLFNWSMKQGLVRLPGGRERAPEIRFLTLPQIDEQLDALRFKPQLQCMVAMLIYAGLRREELLWLTLDDVELQHWGNTGAYAGGGVNRIRPKTIDTAAGERSWQPKTKSNRAVPISRALRAYLDRYSPPASDPASCAEWFFPAPSGGWWDPDNFSADLRQANCVAGMQWACLYYCHNFGSQLAQRGVSHYKIATLMGNCPPRSDRITTETTTPSAETHDAAVPHPPVRRILGKIYEKSGNGYVRRTTGRGKTRTAMSSA